MMNCTRRMRNCPLSSWYRKFVHMHNTCTSCAVSSSAHSSSTLPFMDAQEYRRTEFEGYTVTGVTEIPEYSALAVQLIHQHSGAQHLHVARDDTNNVFSVAFRTVPMDSTGVPHILEHSVLCGSRKYPVRDPFFKMLNRSLSTFMNAMTASDWTAYPFSTQNEKDYENLMSVYLDATFFPNLHEMDFRQEGWRLEHSDLRDPESDIIFKGVVFNEMKGAFSNPESLYCSRHQSLLLPSHTYGVESGGDPLHIPQLTWDQLKMFYAKSYHPSNCLFFTYGNFPLERTLQQIDQQVLQQFEKIEPGNDIPEEVRWKEPKVATVTCSPDTLAPDPNKQHKVSVSFMLDALKDPFESFTINILSALLVVGPNSPFYQALIESNIGSQYSPICGADTNTKNPSFGVGLQGIHEDDTQKVVDLIEETLEKVYVEGFKEQRIESILHSAELSKKHEKSNFGLGLALGIVSYWSHGNNPVDFLEFDETVRRFRQTLSDNPRYLQDKVKEYFLDNSHKLTLTMKPDDNYTRNNELAEQELLKEKVGQLSDEDKKQLLKDGLLLEEKQHQVEDLSCLPRMQLSDINREVIRTKVHRHLEDGNVVVFTCEQPTNDLTYFRAISTTSSLPYNLKPYLPLFCQVLPKLGAGSRNHKELAHAVEMTTGGLATSVHLVPHHTDETECQLGISLSSYCLKENVPNMFSLWQDIFNQPKLTEHDYLRTLINAYAGDLAMSVADSGHRYAMSSAGKYLTKYGQLEDLLGGISQVEFMKSVAEKEDLDETMENLIKIAAYMLNTNEMRCLINTTPHQMDASVKALEGMLSSMNTVGFAEETFIDYDHFQAKSKKKFIEMDFPINYVSKCVPSVPYTHPDHARLLVLAKLMSAKYLHREIRERGGAYGSGAVQGSNLFSFFSFRDPNVESTFSAFDGAAQWITDGNFTEEDIEEAKLSIFSSLDSPVSPGSRGLQQFRLGLTDRIRQKNRDRLFSTNREDLVAVCKKYLTPGSHVVSKAVIGPKNEICSEW